MTKIVNFEPKTTEKAQEKAKKTPAEPLIWICQCGCSTFELMSDGTVRCAICLLSSPGPEGGWYPPDTDRQWEGDTPVRDISANGDVDFAKNRVRRYANEDDIATLLVLKENGNLHLWCKVETPEQLEWLKRKFETALQLAAQKIT